MQALDDTWKHIRRSPYQSLAAVITMFLTMLLAGLFFLVSAGSTLVLGYFESKPQITVFFTDNATQADAEGLQTTLKATGKVSSMNYVSKDDALAIYREQNKNDPLLLEMVTADILPASLEISAIDPAYLAELEPAVKKAQGVEEVVFQKDLVDTLLRWTNAIRVIGTIVVALFVINAILIVMTVTGMKIALKKDEVEILKLVGASPWYIRLPFVLEGGMYGAMGSVVAWFLLFLAGLSARSMISGFLGMIPFVSVVFGSITTAPFIGFWFAFLLTLSVVGFLLGSVGSLVALGRYLKF